MKRMGSPGEVVCFVSESSNSDFACLPSDGAFGKNRDGEKHFTAGKWFYRDRQAIRGMASPVNMGRYVVLAAVSGVRFGCLHVPRREPCLIDNR
jgi:hypothetical protein